MSGKEAQRLKKLKTTDLAPWATSFWVVHRKPQQQFFERLGSAVKSRTVLPGFFHDTLGERDRAVAVKAVRQ